MLIRTLATALVLGATAVTAAAAEPIACGSREEMTERLKRTFGEAQTGLGLVSAASVIEVWSSKETGTWTILMTDPEGQSCLVAAGEAWKSVPWSEVAMGEPA